MMPMRTSSRGGYDNAAAERLLPRAKAWPPLFQVRPNYLMFGLARSPLRCSSNRKFSRSSLDRAGRGEGTYF